MTFMINFEMFLKKFFAEICKALILKKKSISSAYKENFGGAEHPWGSFRGA